MGTPHVMSRAAAVALSAGVAAGGGSVDTGDPPTIFNAPGIIAALAVAGTSLLLLCAWLANERRPDGAVRLPSLLMTLQVSSVLVASTGAWVLTYLSAHNSLHDTATQLVVVAGEGVRAKVTAVLSNGRKVAAAAQQRMKLEASGYPTTHRALQAVFQEFADESMYAVYFGTEDGSMFLIGPGSQFGGDLRIGHLHGPWLNCRGGDAGCVLAPAYDNFGVPSDPREWDPPPRVIENRGYCSLEHAGAGGDTVFGALPNGTRGRLWSKEAGCEENCCSIAYDPRARPWYSHDGGDNWVSYDFPWFAGGQRVRGMTVSKPVLNESGDVLGTVGVDFTVAGLSQFLRDNLPTPGSSIFVVEEGGGIAATSLPQLPVGVRSVLDEWEWRGLFRDVVLRYGSIGEAAKARPRIRYGSDGADLFKGVPTFTSNWLLVIHVPYSDITGDAEDASVLALAIVVAAALCSGLALSAFIFRVLRPLQIVVGQMARVAQLQLDNLEQPPESFVRELQRLRDYYLGMVDALRYYRDFVPQSMMASSEVCPIDMVSDSQQKSPLSGRGRLPQISPVRTDSAGGSLRRSLSSSRLSSMSQSAFANAVVGMPTDHRLAHRRVSLVTANVRRWLDGLEAASVQEFASQHTDYVSRCVEAVKAEKGIADFLLGDRVLMNFNGVRVNGQHALRATQTALRIAKPVPGGLKTSAGASSGKCLCGNMGTAGLKTYAFVGAAASMVHACERAATLWSLGCVIDTTVYQEVACAVVCKILCRVSLRRSGGRHASLYEPIRGVPSSGESGEWMYLVGSDPLSPYNTAAELLLCGEVAEAKDRCEKDPDREGIPELAEFIAEVERAGQPPTAIRYHSRGFPDLPPLQRAAVDDGLLLHDLENVPGCQPSL